MRWVIGIAAVLFAATASAGPSRHARICGDVSADPELRVTACTRLIEARPDTQTFIDRGDARFLDGDWEAAMADYSEALKREPNNVAALTKRARLHFAFGNTTLALADLDRAIAIAPDANLYASRGEILFSSGRTKDAIAAYTTALTLEPRNAAILRKRAKVHQWNDDDAAARNDFDRAIEYTLDDPEAYVDRAAFFRQHVRFEQAMKDLTKAIELDPTYLPAYDQRAGVYEQLGLYTDAVQDLTMLNRAHPDDVSIIERRAHAFFELGESDLAIADATTALKAAPTPENLQARGFAYLQKGDIAHARTDFEDAAHGLRHNENLAVRLRQLFCRAICGSVKPGALLKTLVLGLWNIQAEAIGLTDHARTRRRLIADADALLGLLALKQSDSKAATAIFNAALLISNESPVALYGRGVVKHQAGGAAGAKDDFVAGRNIDHRIDHTFALVGIEPVPETRTIMREPAPDAGVERDIAICDGAEMTPRADGSPDFTVNIEACTRALRGETKKPVRSQAYYQRAQWLAQTGDVAAATIDIDAALAIDPRHVDALLARAALAARERKFDRAIIDFDAALEVEPASFHALFGRCEARVEIGDIKGGVADCDRAVELSRDPDVFGQRRAPVLLRAGEYKRALSDYDAVLRHAARQGLGVDPYALFGRGIARKKLGDAAGADADLKAARRQHPGIDQEYAALGLKP